MGRTGWIVLGVVLLVAGLGSFFLEGVSWITNETVIDAGPLQVTAEEEQRVGLPVWLSLALAVAGAAVLMVGVKKPREK